MSGAFDRQRSAFDWCSRPACRHRPRAVPRCYENPGMPDFRFNAYAELGSQVTVHLRRAAPSKLRRYRFMTPRNSPCGRDQSVRLAALRRPVRHIAALSCNTPPALTETTCCFPGSTRRTQHAAGQQAKRHSAGQFHRLAAFGAGVQRRQMSEQSQGRQLESQHHASTAYLSVHQPCQRVVSGIEQSGCGS